MTGEATERRAAAIRPLRLIARGEDCEVLLAMPSRRTSPGTTRWLALKRLRADRVGDEETRAALSREIEVARALRHPNLAAVRDARLDGRSPSMACDYVDGPDLATLLLEVSKRGRRLDLRAAVGVLVGVARVLRYLHLEAGALLGAPGRALVHDDLGPDNVLVAADGHVALADFGRAFVVGGAAPPAAPRAFTPALTPERVRGRPIDARSDVFLAGALFYECLTGEHPFLRDTVRESAREVGRATPPPVEARRAVPPEVAALVERTLDADPARRFADGGELLDALLALDLPGLDAAPSVLADEVASVFPAHDDADKPFVLRGRTFHPPFLPMVLSWLPPPVPGPEGPRAAVPGWPTQLGPVMGRAEASAERERPWEVEPGEEPDVQSHDETDFGQLQARPSLLADALEARTVQGATGASPDGAWTASALTPLATAAPRRRRRKSAPAPPRRARGLTWRTVLLLCALSAAVTSLLFVLFVPHAPDGPDRDVAAAVAPRAEVEPTVVRDPGAEPLRRGDAPDPEPPAVGGAPAPVSAFPEPAPRAASAEVSPASSPSSSESASRAASTSASASAPRASSSSESAPRAASASASAPRAASSSESASSEPGPRVSPSSSSSEPAPRASSSSEPAPRASSSPSRSSSSSASRASSSEPAPRVSAASSSSERASPSSSPERASSPASSSEPPPRAPSSSSEPPPPAPSGQGVAVILQTDPPGASLVVDGERVGVSPVTLRRAPGLMLQVQAELAGYRPTARVLPVPDAGGAYTLRLVPLQ